MKKLSIPSKLEEKIFDLQWNPPQVKITIFFPLTEEEKSVFTEKLNAQISFKSIFSDIVSDSEWDLTKDQIIKKFQNELIDIE